MVDVVGLVELLLLVRRRPLEPAHRRDRRQQPHQLGVLRPVALDEQRAALGVEAERQQAGRHLARPRAAGRRRRGCSSARGSRRCSRSPRTRTGASRSCGSRRGRCRGGRSRTAGCPRRSAGRCAGAAAAARATGRCRRSWGRSVRDRSHRPARPRAGRYHRRRALPRHQLRRREPPAPARRRARRGHRRPRGRARAARAVAAPGAHPTARRWSSPASRSGTWPGRGPHGIPEDLLTDAPGAPRREPRRRRDRRGRWAATSRRGRWSRRPSPTASAVVTANKHLLAHHGPELERTSRAPPTARCGSRPRWAAASRVLGPLVAGPRREPDRARPRDRQRDDELHPDGDGARGPRLRRRPRRGPGARLRGGRPDRRRRGPRRRQQARDPRPARVRRVDRSRRGRPTGRARPAAGTGPRASPGSPRTTSPRWRPRAGCCASSRRPGSPTDGALEASVVPTAVPGGLAVRALRRRAQPGRGRRRAGGPGRVRGSGRRRARDGRRRCSATSSRSRAGSARPGPGAAPALERSALAVRPVASNASRRRPAPATRPRTEAPVISPDHARPTARRALPRVPARRGRPRRSSRWARARRRSSTRGASARPSALRNLHLKVEGQNPTGSVQGPRDGPGRREGARGRRPERHLRVDRQHVGLGRRLCRRRRARVRRRAPGRQDRRRQAAPGARVRGAGDLACRGNFDEALRVVRALSEQDEHPITLVNSVNPFRLEGQKTAAFEVCDDLGRAPGRARDPGRQRGQHQRLLARLPRVPRGRAHRRRRPGMWGFQAAGAAPLVAGRPIDHPETVATAIRIGNPASWTLAIDGARRVGRPHRRGHRRRDPRAPTATLARLEGVFCEPSSAASRRRRHEGGPRGRARPATRLVVCVLTGNGLKDPTTAEAGLTVEVVEAEPSVADVSAGARLVVSRVRAAGGRVPGRPSSGAGSPSRSRRRPPTSGRATTASGSRWTSSTTSRSRACDGDGSIELEVTGEGAVELPSTRGEPVRRGPRGGARGVDSGRGPPASAGGSRWTTRIPLSRGLGSSAAATVGGVVAGAALAELAGATRPTTTRCSRSRRPSSPTRTTRPPCCSAGSSSRRSSPIASRPIRFDAPDGLRCVLYIPDRRLATEDMRRRAAGARSRSATRSRTWAASRSASRASRRAASSCSPT